MNKQKKCTCDKVFSCDHVCERGWVPVDVGECTNCGAGAYGQDIGVDVEGLCHDCMIEGRDRAINDL